MSITTCAISGLPLQEPVLSRKSGHVFEKELIMKQIKATGQCPITGQNLEEEDLIAISGRDFTKFLVEKAATPRTITTTTVPGLLSVMQSEWDSLLLESFKLRSDLDATRQELSHALHQYDAACRVICRLIKERDEARRDVAAQGEVRVMPQEFQQRIQQPSHLEEEKKQVKLKDPGQKFVDGLESMHSILSQKRMNKELPPQNPVPESRYSKLNGNMTTIDVSGESLLTSVDFDYRSKQVLAAGEAGCFVYDLESQSPIYSLTDHKGGIKEAVFSQDDSGVLMASRDGMGTLAVLKPQSSYSVPILLKKDSSPLTSCKFSTVKDYALFGAEDGTVTLHNIATSQTVSVIGDQVSKKAGLSCLSLHPDGVLLATGSSNGVVALWDLRSNTSIKRLNTGAEAVVNSLDFSSKGIYLASATQGCNFVEVWDPRNLDKPDLRSKAVKLNHFTQQAISSIHRASSIRYDISGKVMAVAGEAGIEFFKGKGQKSLGLFTKEKNLTAVQISPNGEIVASVSSDGKLYLNRV